MNSVKISGRLTKEPIITTYAVKGENEEENSANRAFFTIASNVVAGRKTNNATYINCVAFRLKADLIEKFVHAKDYVIVEGHLAASTYEKNNEKFQTMQVVVDDIEFVISHQKNKNEGESTNNEEGEFIDVTETDLPLPPFLD